MAKSLFIIAHDIRSAHNVGALMRTCEGLGVDEVHLTGYTPYPSRAHETRLPHIAAKVDKQINKTALGAQNTLKWRQISDVFDLIQSLKKDGFTIAALEQHPDSTPLTSFKSPEKLAILLGSEVDGIDKGLLAMTDLVLEIPMAGQKESFNVVEAASMAAYHCKYIA